MASITHGPRRFYVCLALFVLSLVVLCGDVGRNPGPSCLCTLCNKSVSDSCRAIYCDNCFQWTHASCCHVDGREYNRISLLGDSFEWLCPWCCQSTLPVANFYWE